MPALSLAARPPGRLGVCDARPVGVRAGLYPQRTRHKTALAAAVRLAEPEEATEEDGRASRPLKTRTRHAPELPRAAVNSQ